MFPREPTRPLTVKQKSQKRSKVLQMRDEQRRNRYGKAFDQLSESESWGFKVTYSADADSAIFRQEAERLRNTQTRNEKRKEAAAARLRAEREAREDYTLYLLCAHRWGALPGEIYCTYDSSTRGQAYMNLANEMTTKLQRWWNRVRWACSYSQVCVEQDGCLTKRHTESTMGEEKETDVVVESSSRVDLYKRVDDWVSEGKAGAAFYLLRK